jgi:hypothetical protein
MHSLDTIIVILLFMAALIPMAVLYACKKYLDYRLSWFKSVACFFLFEFSFAPYAYAGAVLGGLDLVYFISIWAIFYFFYFRLTPLLSLAFSFIGGLLLTTPVSLFISYSSGDIIFSISQGVSLSFNERSNIYLIFYKLGWAVMPMVCTHFIMQSMDNKKIGKES